MRRASVAALASLLLLVLLPVAPASAASAAKVVIVVGPVGSLNAHYKADAEQIATEARRWTPNVVKLTTPNATWARVKAAMQGASVFVYLGHGNGWPSPYPPFQTVTKDGLGLDPGTGADGSKTVYYGEDYLRSDIRLAPNAVVLLFHLCYASGNTEPGMAVGTVADARQRVDNYGAGFMGAGARAVFAEGHPSHPVTSYVRQLFTTSRTMDQVFRAAPTWHGHLQGPFPSQRTPGLQFEMDPDSAAPAGFYRSLVGDLSLKSTAVVGTPPARTDTIPADFVVPGAAEVASAGGAGLYATAEAAADPAGVPSATLADGTRLRVTEEAAPAADGGRILGVTVIGSATKGFARAGALVPRDSAPVVIWTLDQSGALLSPNGDGIFDGLAVAARFSEPVPSSLVVKNAAGTTVKTVSQTGDIVRLAWDLKTASGARVADGDYTWTLTGSDPWANGNVRRSGSFSVDGTAPVSTAAVTGTAGAAGWITSTAAIALTAKDVSGIGQINWRLDGGTVTRYAPPLAVGANGSHTLEYRAIDRAGVREAWRSIAFKVDSKAPTITLPAAGTAGAAAGTWRSAVTLAPTVKDAVSGVASKTVTVDGGEAAALDADPVVVDGDGTHTVKVAAKDAAGNASTATLTFTIDTTAPTLELPAAGDPPPAVSPNGDGIGETAALPFSASEPGSVTATISNAAAKVVRTLTLPVGAGAGSIAWDGRDAAGKAVPDGRYEVKLVATDVAGNAGAPAPVVVDVYAALKGVTRAPTLFYPQDGDTLAKSTTASYTLLTPATVSIQVLDAKGVPVRTDAAKPMAAGAATWAWNGKTDDGAWAPIGTYRIAVTATNGTQSATQIVAVGTAAFRVTTSTAPATRGKPLTVTVVSVEPLATAPKLTVRQPGLADLVITMTRGGSAWTATVTPKKTGPAGTLTLIVKGKDTAGGTNGTTVRLALQ